MLKALIAEGMNPYVKIPDYYWCVNVFKYCNNPINNQGVIGI